MTAVTQVGKGIKPEGRASRAIPATAWLVVPTGLFFVIFFVLPFALMALLSILSGNPLTQSNVGFTSRSYERFAADPLYLEALWETLWLGGLTTLAALLMGYPIALWLARMRSKTGYTLLLMAVVAPMLTGIVVRTFAWMTILSDKGVINVSLASLGLIDRPLPLMYNAFGTIVALVHIYVPFMVLTLAGVIGRIDHRLEEAAISLGANRFRAFLEVTLPLSLPGILAGSLLVFALTISAYVTPYLMGGSRVLTLPMLIYQQVSASFNIAFAATLGVVLLAVSLVLLMAYNRIISQVSGREDLA